ncbi:Conserved hypothetical protein (UPF0066 superfamily) [Chondrus crispus]|uniref:TsaA-like domain-containing protein n=1 Tax=Chondrus crispus TaxID=2769 RepID=R7QR15_CHOCR|nr:Conserved hypothetical protein (UPF0066 superfamily) [Chondrus crispus]CDF40559.1 Conserved hypothetical protein (UPF0066 superfamily) [Chondrus crispus]|eukprot:XP_005710853.1 Conserved hypothetical protein (UPF0066 superfamily) [Chondrus crispus]
MSRPRHEQIATLQAFQEADLHSLRERLSELDARIAQAEEAVLHAANVASAARGLVGQRGGVAPALLSSTSRARPKQRLWARKDGTYARHDEHAPPKPHVLIQPCGVVYTAFQKRFEAPRQSFTGAAGKASVWLTNGTHVLHGLSKGDRLWLVYWLDRNDGLWRHFVRPPRAKGGWRVGVFATRSPNRPSPVGLSLCVVENVDLEKGCLQVGGVDILDETPLLAVRKYVPEEEAWPSARAGWIDEMEKLQPLYYDELDGYGGVADWEVVVEEGAGERIEFINERSAVDVVDMIRTSLERVDAGEAKEGGEEGRREVVEGALPVGAFRVLYEVRRAAGAVVVKQVVSGMRRTVCEEEAATDPEALVHLEFQDRFPL